MRPTGFEPVSLAWKAKVLNQTRLRTQNNEIKYVNSLKKTNHLLQIIKTITPTNKTITKPAPKSR